jgi:molecular chaperone GrpE
MEKWKERSEVEGADLTDAAQKGPAPSDVPPPAADDLAALTPEELRGKLRQAREDVQRNWQHFLHSAADLENYKKHAARERQEAVERTRRQMLGLVLSVLDNLERAMAFGEGQGGPSKGLVDGLRMTHRQVLSQLEAIGVRPIDSVGKRFDPRLHEAVTVVSESGAESGMIVGEVQKGYLLNDDVLRPAKVAVAGAPDRE